MARKLPIGLQLYSVRKDCEKDFFGVLRAVGDMGYDGVEFAGYYGRTARELRRMLEECGLTVAGAHVGIDNLLGPKLEETIAFHRELGNTFIVVPGLPKERTASRRAWEETADLFTGLAETLRVAGMRLGYHNHMVEFQELEGVKPWDLLFDRTDDVIMQLDTGNAMHGGGDPVHYLQKYPGRAVTVHLKEFSEGNDKVIGEGKVDWPTVLELCETIGGTQWYIVEQESYPYPPLECVRKCLENLRKMGR